MTGVPVTRRFPLICVIAAFLVLPGVFVGAPKAAELSETIKRIKPSIVGIGTYQKTRRPPAVLRGTGFVVADGRHVVTNAHVLPETLNEWNKEFLAVFVGRGRNISVRRVERVAADADHDVAVVRFPDSRLPTLRLGDDDGVEEGQAIAFTGYPIGSILGLFPVTHRGIVSSVTPIAIPLASQRHLDADMIRRLRNNFRVFQLDATAYPGNSGSPVFDPDTGAVYAIVSSVFVKKSKEKVLQDPSGITYAIPIRHARALLKELGLRD
jgi:S1-C subfamily serine protease